MREPIIADATIRRISFPIEEIRRLDPLDNYSGYQMYMAATLCLCCT
jgi:hypothetical protein